MIGKNTTTVGLAGHRKSTSRWRRMRNAALIFAGTVGLLASSGAVAGAIIGGEKVEPSQYPYFVKVLAIRSDGAEQCGGTVIADATILTAAHCVDHGAAPSGITVYVFDQQPETAIGLTVHPLWDGDPSDGHDLAIVRLEPFATTGVTPVQVGAPWDPIVYSTGMPATMVGHGSTTPDGHSTVDLRALNTSIRSDSDMDDVFNRWWTPDYWTSNLMIGAGNSDHTACTGDSGGPLVVFRSTKWVLVGVASFVWPWPTNCSEAAGFAEIAGPQLAWIASEVPQIVPGWNGCISPTGYSGESISSYRTYSSPYAQSDGPYYWAISCVSYEPQPPTSTPPPPPPPPRCQHNPRCQEN
jgi:trypsin